MARGGRVALARQQPQCVGVANGDASAPRFQDIPLFQAMNDAAQIAATSSIAESCSCVRTRSAVPVRSTAASSHLAVRCSSEWAALQATA